jgi:hypothetical protein
MLGTGMPRRSDPGNPSTGRRRVDVPRVRARAVPARSRVTVRRSQAPLLRSTSLAAALQDSREALGSIQGELDALLAALRASDDAPPVSAAERLRAATRAAAQAFSALDRHDRR